jgi:hypothetical protein
MVRKCIAGLFALVLIAWSSGAAQTKATELTVGVIGFSYTSCSGCDGIFIASTGGAENGVFSGLGGGSVGLGFYVGPGMSIEPTLALSHLSSGGENLTLISAGIAVPYYFAKGWGRKGGYIAPRATYNSLSGGGTSVTQFALGAAFGTKVPLNDMAALRLQANFDYGFESSDVASTTAFGALMGLSVFLKK